MPLPKCEYPGCKYDSTYFYLSKGEEWRNGCVAHWRADAKHYLELGVDVAVRLHRTPEEVAAAWPDTIETPIVVQPRISQQRKKREKKVFRDMEPGEIQKTPKDGSVLHKTIELCRKLDGATLEEIQVEIGEKHDALKLLLWANEERGWGWKRGEDDRIRVLPQ